MILQAKTDKINFMFNHMIANFTNKCKIKHSLLLHNWYQHVEYLTQLYSPSVSMILFMKLEANMHYRLLTNQEKLIIVLILRRRMSEKITLNCSIIANTMICQQKSTMNRMWKLYHFIIYEGFITDRRKAICNEVIT